MWNKIIKYLKRSTMKNLKNIEANYFKKAFIELGDNNSL